MSTKYNWTTEYSNRTISSDNCLFTLTIDNNTGVCRERFATPTGLCGAEFKLSNLGDMGIDTYMEAAANSYLWRYNHEGYNILETASKLGVDCLDDGTGVAVYKADILKQAAKDLNVRYVEVVGAAV